MLKIKNQTATREAIPEFLQGLSTESLVDLSWTDAALGVQDCAWFPEESSFQSLQQFEKYGDEIFTIDSNRKVVVVSRQIVQMSQDEIDEINAQKELQKQQYIDDLTSRIASLQQQLLDITQPTE